ncbi:MAG: hypothetical protein Fur006_21030 [Coleofasciculaceae cyanobacterium]
MTFSCVPLTQLGLDVSPDVQNQSWQQSQSFVTHQGRWNAYLNQMCLSTFLPWLQEEYEPEATVWTDDTALPSFWEIVNGTAITVDTKRFVLIPDKTLETREFSVPQEWVDIPGWAGDYYLAVQVDPEGEWLRIWGYTTHEQLKINGNYDPSDRTYWLDATEMIEDLNVLWVVRQLCPDEQTRAAIAPLPVVPDTQAENLLERLANPAILNPRLELPFELWGALLEREEWRQRLYQQRRGQSAEIVSTPVRVNLSQWFQNIFEDTWTTIEALFPSQPDFALSLRRTSEQVVRRAKLINLETQVPSPALVLLLILEAEADGRMGIRIQLRPTDADAHLPANIRLALLSPTGETIQHVEARDRDNHIQLKRFKCPPGTPFAVQIALNEANITEEFVS